MRVRRRQLLGGGALGVMVREVVSAGGAGRRDRKRAGRRGRHVALSAECTCIGLGTPFIVREKQLFGGPLLLRAGGSTVVIGGLLARLVSPATNGERRSA